jgi:tetratricopeptide (TPR) repeat protein
MTLVFSVPDISEYQRGAWYRHKEEIAFLISVLFLVHPIQTQAVTYISQRFTSLAGMFYLLSVCMYLKGRLKVYLAKNEIWAVVYFMGAALSAVLAMFSKETAFTLPFCIFLMEFSFFKGKRSKLFWRSMICVLLFTLLIPYLYSFKIAGVFSRHANHGITGGKYFMTQFRVILTYIRLLFFPVGQNVDYDFPLSQSIFELRTCLSLAILLIILTTAVIIFRRQVLSVTVLIFSCLTFQRNKVWRSEISLWMDTVKKSPRKARPYHNLGNAYLRQKDYASAIVYLSKAIELNPGVKASYNNRANAYKKEKKYKKAFADYQKAIDLDPKYPRVYFNRGNTYRELGEYSKALNDYDTAIELNPEYERVYFNRGNIYKEQRQYTEALDNYEIALGLKPGWAQVYNNVGNILVSLNESERTSEIYEGALRFKLGIKKSSNGFLGKDDFQELALESYAKAIEINPYYMAAYFNRARIYSAQGIYYKALKDYDMALSLEPHNARALWGRSHVYFSTGEFQKALDDAIKSKSLSAQKKPMDLQGSNEYINQLKQLIMGNNINAK